jgi:hypothetical protein
MSRRTLGRGGGGGGGREEGGGEAEVQAAGARHQHPGRDPEQVGDPSVSLYEKSSLSLFEFI